MTFRILVDLVEDILRHGDVDPHVWKVREGYAEVAVRFLVDQSDVVPQILRA